MATNDDLDDFFKKKDRKGNKHKKQPGLLTNNEELLKQLVIVTSATSAFKENMDFDDDEDELHIHEESVIGTVFPEETPKHPTSHHKSKISDDNKHFNGQQPNLPESTGQAQQDEWEEFIDPDAKYKELRLKFSRENNDDDNDEEYGDDEHNPNHNEENNEKNLDREQQKDKPVWKMNQVKQEIETIVPNVEEKIEEPPPKPAATSTGGVYRPPQMRSGGSAVTVISGVSQRPTKKKELNVASTDEFPTLGSAVNKK
jgi:hypothetical protein